MLSLIARHPVHSVRNSTRYALVTRRHVFTSYLCPLTWIAVSPVQRAACIAATIIALLPMRHQDLDRIKYMLDIPIAAILKDEGDIPVSEEEQRTAGLCDRVFGYSTSTAIELASSSAHFQ